MTQSDHAAQTVLVTGGTGFIGGWCIIELLKRGYTVRTTIRSLGKEASLRAALATQVDAGLVADHLTVFAADLTKDDGWDAATSGCDYVLHVASPLGADNPKDPDVLIVPARDGALRALRAATKAGVKRVVLTSSIAACSPLIRSGDATGDESRWTSLDDPDLNAYRQSKTIAERAAWDFMADHIGNTTLTTVLPGAVLGPVLTKDNLGSVQLVSRLLDGSMPGTPALGFNMVDVRDVADLHIRAMTAPEAAGERFIAAGDFLWIANLSRILRSELGRDARKVPTRRVPDFVLKLVALFDPTLRLITPNLGRAHRFSAAKAEHMLGWTARPVTATVVDCAHSLLATGAVKV